MSTQMIIRLDPALKARLKQLALTEGKNTSQVVRELIEGYVVERDPARGIEELWDRIGERLKARGITSKEINKAIRNVRSTSE